MEEVIRALELFQFAISLLILIPVLYWVKMKIFQKPREYNEDTHSTDSTMSLILPMRNESTNVIRKLNSILSEILHYESVELIVADSNSTDETASMASKFLEESELDDSRWKVINIELPGKNRAINRVLKDIDSEIVAISDADARVSPGWLNIVRTRLSEGEVGVVSGIEIEAHSGHFNRYYRSRSNWLRIHESRGDSTPVLEGSLLAWKQEALGPFKINENMNADDAQIGLQAIRRGFRAIVDSRITFAGFEQKSRTLNESIRRSQGLSIALMRNADLIFSAPRNKAKAAIFNALILYVMFPWLLLLFAINSIVAFSMEPIMTQSWQAYSLASILAVSLSPQGRSMILGSAISIRAHVQLLLGKRYNSWEPIR